PLLYQVASAALAPADIAQPIRTILREQRNTRVMLGEVRSVDLTARTLRCGERHIPYDYLVLAPGAIDNYFGHEDWQPLAPGMKVVEEATLIRSRLLRSFESAEIESDPAQRLARLTFVIVGGGPTGVELAGAIKELAVDVIPRDFRVADTRRARVLLIEAGPRLLPALHPDSSARALRQLRELGVEVRLGQPVTAVHADGVVLGGETLSSHNVIWAAGVRAAPLLATLGVALGPGGRVAVAPDCSVRGHPEVFVIGDAAYLEDAAGRVVPGVSQAALQMGRYVAHLIEARVLGRDAPTGPFRYRDYGAMATVGKSRAVVEIGRLRFGGLAAWLAWMALHITVLIGFRNRLAVLSSWIYSYVFFRRGSRLITRGTGALGPDLQQHPS
ncbi:MAG: NAD(P)/FAD-dependent oxidoreductase, partial [Gammaproteobacteria bacterium]|nr:NAD(P)/FAD-dependent oxidoreductase [Gammaproteobacteria bacterium]